MSLSEFELIERYFRGCGAKRADVRLGVGDDAAILRVSAGRELVAAIDTLVDGVHFPHGSPPASVGHRALAVNLSDLAAMGARPAWALLALTLPQADEPWLAEFAAGWRRSRARTMSRSSEATRRRVRCASPSRCWDTCRAVLRCCGRGGRAGDAVFVSGTPGDAAAGLAIEQAKLAVAGETAAYLRERFLLSLAAGGARGASARLRQPAASTCRMDCSADAGKAGAGQRLRRGDRDYGDVPVSDALVSAVGEERARELALTGGDDYELCFSVRPAARRQAADGVAAAALGLQRIGTLRESPGAGMLSDGTVMRSRIPAMITSRHPERRLCQVRGDTAPRRKWIARTKGVHHSHACGCSPYPVGRSALCRESCQHRPQRIPLRPSRPRAEVPEKIGKYVVIKEVGRGSTGMVYLSHDAYYGRDVAIKVYNIDSGGDEERARIARKMFLSEAHLVGMLQHPHILPIYDAGEENGHCYIVTEHVHGARTLAAYCRPDNLLRIDDTVEIIFKCAKALHYAHSRGVIHRDIKPSNIMLTQDSDVRIIDFGIALVSDSDISRIEGIAGSPSYMSPEQVQSLELTNRSDLYSLGAVMYELLTGSRPFRAGNLQKLLHQIVYATPPPIHTLAQGYARGAGERRGDGAAEGSRRSATRAAWTSPRS